MAVGTRNPVRYLGANISGANNTGELRTTRGGEKVYTLLSGIIGGDQLIVSGAGRLNTILPLTGLISGQAVLFYDSALNTSGGPFMVSGHNVVGIVPPLWRVGASGAINDWSAPGNPVPVDVPFFSGLCAAAVSSGTGGFTITYTVETSSNA